MAHTNRSRKSITTPRHTRMSGSVCAVRRRNGIIASCEPCRKRKLRCDHELPACHRCRRRGEHASCYYHPAPLTHIQSSAPQENANVPEGVFRSRSLQYSPASPLQPTSINNVDDLPIVRDLYPEREVNNFLAEAPLEHNIHTISSLAHLHRESEEHITSVVAVLSCLREYDLIRNLLITYHSASQALVIPGPLILNGLAPISEVLDLLGVFDHVGDHSQQLVPLSKAVLRSTSSPLTITASLKPSEFIGLYTGTNLRLEYLSIVFSIAARSCLLGLAKDGEQHGAFIQEMYCSSKTCLRLAQQLAPVNDILIWSAQEYLMLAACIEGDSSDYTWRCLGDLCSDITALGIHRENLSATEIPFFLVECRRKVFAKAYHTDKFLATLFDRPPRLLKRYSDTQLPLDLTDAELLADTAVLIEARRQLTRDGWSMEEKFCASTWTRVRFLLAEMLEEILEYKYHPRTIENISALKNISQRIWVIWRSIPSHLHYETKCWVSKLHPQICFMLAVIRLSFLKCDFQIFQALERDDLASKQRLLGTSAEIVSLIEELGSYRRKAIYLHRRFSYIILLYGLAPAITLAKATQSLLTNESSIPSCPPMLSRSRLIRALNVFSYQLDSISGPGEPNNEICIQASKAICRTLDKLLNPAPEHHDTTCAPFQDFTDVVNFESGIIGSEAPDINIWNGFDSFNWVDSIS